MGDLLEFRGKFTYVETGDLEPVPLGTYELAIVETESKTGNEGGRILKATMQIASGQYKNRKIWENFTLIDKSGAVNNVSLSKLKDIAKSLGMPDIPANSTELMYKNFFGKIGIEPAQNGYKAKNKYLGVGKASDVGKALSQPVQASAVPLWETKKDYEDDVPF